MGLKFLRSLSGKLLVVTSIAIIIISVLFNILLYIQTSNRIEEEMVSALELKSELASDSLSLPVWSLNDMVIKAVIDALMKDRRTVQIVLYDEVGQILYQSSKDSLLDSDHLLVEIVDVYKDQTFIGTLKYVITSDYEKAELRAQQIQNIYLLILQIIILIVLIRLVTKLTLEPLNEMEEVAIKISSGDLNNTISPIKNSELSSLRDALLTMQSNLDYQQKQISQQISELNQKNDELSVANNEIEHLYEDSEKTNIMLNHALVKNQKAYTETVISLAKAVEACDPYTAGHCERVNEYSAAIGRELGYPELAIRELRLAATLHDIGKIGVPTDILRKPAKLTDDEYDVIKSHSQKGYDILNGVEILKKASVIVLQHHERVDGLGYPSGLVDHEICDEAKIISVVDSYDAMTSVRPYRVTPYSVDRAISELKIGAGSQFDPVVVDTLIRLIERGVINDEK